MRKLLVPTLLLLPLLIGCDRDDVNRLGKAGRIAATKSRSILPLHLLTWDSAIDAIRSAKEESPLDRVKQRLGHDRYLRPYNLEAIGAGGTITLRGKVNDPIVKERAVELVESTLGVEKVIDEITVMNH